MTTINTIRYDFFTHQLQTVNSPRYFFFQINGIKISYPISKYIVVILEKLLELIPPTILEITFANLEELENPRGHFERYALSEESVHRKRKCFHSKIFVKFIWSCFISNFSSLCLETTPSESYWFDSISRILFQHLLYVEILRAKSEAIKCRLVFQIISI